MSTHLHDTEPVIVTADRSSFVQEHDFAARQYRGKRENQEDYYAFADASDQDEAPLARLLLALGDGLGAHAGGSVASYVTVGSFIRAFHEAEGAASWRLRMALDIANETIGIISGRLPSLGQPMGTTLLSILVDKNSMYWVSVGDSPLFIFRAGSLIRINADHSLSPLLDERVRLGEITHEEALHHPDRHTLQAAVLGMPITMIDGNAEPFILHKGDVIIAASDGIFTLSTRQLEELLSFGQHSTADKIVDAIIFAVRRINYERQDNITVAVVRIA